MTLKKSIVSLGLCLFSLELGFTSELKLLESAQIFSIMLGSAPRAWCQCHDQMIWYNEAGPPRDNYAPGGASYSIWTNSLTAPHPGGLVAKTGFSPLPPILDSKRGVLWYSQRLRDSNRDGIIDQFDGLEIARLDLNTKTTKIVTAPGLISWPLALDPATGRLLIASDGRFAILSAKTGRIEKRLTSLPKNAVSGQFPFFDTTGRAWIFTPKKPPLEITGMGLRPGSPVVLEKAQVKTTIEFKKAENRLCFRFSSPGLPEILIPATANLWPLMIIDAQRSVWLTKHQVFVTDLSKSRYQTLMRLPENTLSLFIDPVRPDSISWLQGDKPGQASLGTGFWAQ